MMYSTMISQLGLGCRPISKTLGIISPFTYCDDGGYVGTSTREVNGRHLVSDRCDALVNMEARGISPTKKRLDGVRQLLLKEGAELNARGKIITQATEKNVGATTSNMIRAGVLAPTLSLDWYQSVQAEKFESMVTDYLYHTGFRDALSLHKNAYGLSRHQITVSVTIETDMPKYVSTSSVKHEGSWNNAYSLLGKLIDLETSSEGYNNRFIVIDNEAISDQMQQLSLLLREPSQVLPSSKRETWAKRLAA